MTLTGSTEEDNNGVWQKSGGDKYMPRQSKKSVMTDILDEGKTVIPYLKVIKRQANYDAVVLSPELVKNLCKELDKYYTNIRFLVFTENRIEIRFDSVDELLDYKNFKEKRIKSLIILGDYQTNYSKIIDYEESSPLHIAFVMPSMNDKNQSIFNYRFSVDSLEKETLLSDFFDAFKNEARPSYSIFSQIHPKSLIAPLIAVLVLLFALVFNYLVIKDPLVKGLFKICLEYLTAYGIVHIMFYNTIFCPMVFLWGGQVKVYERASRLRLNLFWGALVASVLNILVFIITNGIFK